MVTLQLGQQKFFYLENNFHEFYIFKILSYVNWLEYKAHTFTTWSHVKSSIQVISSYLKSSKSSSVNQRSDITTLKGTVMWCDFENLRHFQYNMFNRHE